MLTGLAFTDIVLWQCMTPGSSLIHALSLLCISIIFYISSLMYLHWIAWGELHVCQPEAYVLQFS